MKILSVDISVPRNNAEYWRISNIARILEDNGHEVDLVHYCRRSSYERLRDKKKYNNHKFVITSPMGVQIKHLKILSDKKYDLVYANNGLAAFSSFLGKLTKIPLVFDMHGDALQELLLRYGFSLNPSVLAKFIQYKIMEFANLRASNEIICVSNRMIQYLHNQKGVPLEKMSYVTNGVDLDFFKYRGNERVESLKNKLGMENKIIFGYIGGFHKMQGLTNFIEVAKSIDDNEVAFLIVGGNETSKYGNITFISKIDRLLVPDYYSICDILVLLRPFHIATDIAAPTKFAEYTSMGKPVFTTNVADATQLVKKYECGIVIENNEIKNLKNGINEFKEFPETKLKKMGKNSRKLAEKEFDWEKVSVKLLKALEKFH